MDIDGEGSMNKLTAEVARRHRRDLKSFQENPKIGLSLKEELYLQALEIALPILEQQERGEGDWIEWGGGECPTGDDQSVDIQFRDGEVVIDVFGDCLRWSHKSTPRDIIAYRIIPEWATNQNGEQ
jgi:hypothetical protein